MGAGDTGRGRGRGRGVWAGVLRFGRAHCGAVAPAPSVAPPEVSAGHGTDWPLPGHDYTGSRRAGPSPIDAATVAGLAPAWTVDTTGALTTAPVVVGTTAYAQDDFGVVVAVDVPTGRVLWRSAATGFTVGPEGAAVGWGRVFAATPDGVEALSPATGAVEWTRKLAPDPTTGVDVQPLVAGGKVLVSTVPVTAGTQFAGGDVGVLYALDPATGRTDWSFDTVDSPDVWGDPAVNSGGGSWYPPSVDAATGTVYWGTGNPGPYPGTAAVPQRVEPARGQPLHRLDPGPQPRHRQAPVVPPGGRPRPVRPRLPAHHAGHRGLGVRGQTGRGGLGQGGPGGGHGPGHGEGPVDRCWWAAT